MIKGQRELLEAKAMVRMAARRNKEHIRCGRVKIEQGDFDEKVYPKNFFDKVCSTNTIYFGPDPKNTRGGYWRS